jgi:hypothetical protein
MPQAPGPTGQVGRSYAGYVGGRPAT